MPLKPIVTLTLNPAIDGASTTERVRPIHKIRTTNEQYAPGGGGINAARVIQELGGEVLAVYLAGGTTGGALQDLLQSRGIASRRINIAGNTRIAHAVFETSSGLEYRFVPEGPDVTQDEWRNCLAVLKAIDCDTLLMSGSIPKGLSSGVYNELRSSLRGDIRFVLDTSGAALRETIAQGGLFLVKPSLGELEQLAGRTLADTSEQEAAALSFVRSGKVELMAVTLGHRGAFLAWREGIDRLPAIAVETKSAVGAGDSFLGAMTLRLAQGKPPREAFRWGMAAGAAAVLKSGTELCQREVVERLYAQLVNDAP